MTDTYFRNMRVPLVTGRLQARRIEPDDVPDETPIKYVTLRSIEGRTWQVPVTAPPPRPPDPFAIEEQWIQAGGPETLSEWLAHPPPPPPPPADRDPTDLPPTGLEVVLPGLLGAILGLAFAFGMLMSS